MPREKIQFQIKAQPGDEARVEEVFEAAATNFSLVDTKVTSRVAHTISNYSEKLGDGFGLGARVHEELILVDFNVIGGKTEKFNAVFDFIVSKLRERFSDSMCLADENSRIPAINTLPESAAAREFHSKMIKTKHPEWFQGPQ